MADDEFAATAGVRPERTGAHVHTRARFSDANRSINQMKGSFEIYYTNY
jgi:hypothetical protein